MNAFASLFWMLVGHAIADYPLQGDWLSKAKNHTMNLVPGQTIWPGALLSHAIIHASFVQLATGSWILAGLEMIAHTAIDHTKCQGKLSYSDDQHLHVMCKLIWFAMLLICGPLP